MAITNGFPKSGNHALAKAVQLLGVNCQVDHFPWEDHWSMTSVPRIFIKRDPRNIVLSWLTHKKIPHTPYNFIKCLRNFDNQGDLITQLATYEGWLHDPQTLQIAYEDLISNEKCMQQIAEYLNVPYTPKLWDYLPGMTWSWTDNHADFTTIWNSRIEKAWNQEGGDKLLTRWGY